MYEVELVAKQDVDGDVPGVRFYELSPQLPATSLQAAQQEINTAAGDLIRMVRNFSKRLGRPV